MWTETQAILASLEILGSRSALASRPFIAGRFHGANHPGLYLGGNSSLEELDLDIQFQMLPVTYNGPFDPRQGAVDDFDPCAGLQTVFGSQRAPKP